MYTYTCAETDVNTTSPGRRLRHEDESVKGEATADTTAGSSHAECRIKANIYNIYRLQNREVEGGAFINDRNWKTLTSERWLVFKSLPLKCSTPKSQSEVEENNNNKKKSRSLLEIYYTLYKMGSRCESYDVLNKALKLLGCLKSRKSS